MNSNFLKSALQYSRTLIIQTIWRTWYYFGRIIKYYYTIYLYCMGDILLVWITKYSDNQDSDNQCSTVFWEALIQILRYNFLHPNYEKCSYEDFWCMLIPGHRNTHANFPPSSMGTKRLAVHRPTLIKNISLQALYSILDPISRHSHWRIWGGTSIINHCNLQTLSFQLQFSTSL